jgi:DHA2 family multidrug resistance protein
MTDVGTTAPTPDATWRPRHNPWLIAVVVTLAAFMEIRSKLDADRGSNLHAD